MDNRIILLYKGLKGKARIPTDDLIAAEISTPWPFRYPLLLKMSISFFPQTIRDWDDLPESLISSSELSGDSVAKFTSLVRARDQFPPVTAPGEGLSIWRFTLVRYCHFGVSPVNYSDSDSDQLTIQIQNVPKFASPSFRLYV